MSKGKAFEISVLEPKVKRNEHIVPLFALVPPFRRSALAKLPFATDSPCIKRSPPGFPLFLDLAFSLRNDCRTTAQPIAERGKYRVVLFCLLLFGLFLAAGSAAQADCNDPDAPAAANNEAPVTGMLEAQNCGSSIILTDKLLTLNEGPVVLQFYSGIPTPVGPSMEAPAQLEAREDRSKGGEK